MFKRILRLLKYYSDLKSIYFNLKTLPFNQAITLPIKLSPNVVLRSLQGNIIIESKLFFRGMIEIGYGDVTHIDKTYHKTNIDLKGTMKFNGPAHIGHGSSIRVEGYLELGDQFRITARSTIIACNKVKFGDNCLLAWDVLIMDTDFHNIYDSNGNLMNRNKKIVIGNKVWIGCRSIVLKGSKIGNNCIIAANSLINKEYEEDSLIIAGQPGKPVKTNVSWEI